LCNIGVQICDNGVFGSCIEAVYPSIEVCDGKDNDCDGETDEDIAYSVSNCSVGQGACQSE
jgi:hypothetical protein